MSVVWNTKYGPRRVRFDPPTLQEAISAARGLTGELQLQLMSESMDLLDNFVFFIARRNKYFEPNDLGNIFVHHFISAELNAFECSLSALFKFYLNLLRPVSLSESW